MVIEGRLGNFCFGATVKALINRTAMAASDTFPLAIAVSYLLFYSTVLLLSIVGNVIVLCHCHWTIKRRQSSSSIKWFIANLAVSDLTFTVLSLLDFTAYSWTWRGGNVTCKIQGFLIEACYTVSIMTLVAISYQRRKAVVTPLRVRTDASDSEYKKLIAIWFASLLIGSPLLYAYKVEKDASGSLLCSNTFFGDLGKQVYYSIHALCVFIVPLTYMIYAQNSIFRTLRLRAFPIQDAFATGSRNRHRKVAKTLAAFSVAFAICWTPFIVFRTLVYFHLVDGLRYSWAACQILIFVNTVLDPILYGIYGENMKAFLRRFCKCTYSEISLVPRVVRLT